MKDYILDDIPLVHSLVQHGKGQPCTFLPPTNVTCQPFLRSFSPGKNRLQMYFNVFWIQADRVCLLYGLMRALERKSGTKEHRSAD